VADKAEKTVTKKVKPYPIAATLELNALKKPVEILHLTPRGVLVRVTAQLVFVGEYYTLAFKIPVSGHQISAQIRVLKTFDQATQTKPAAVERRAELYFKTLPDDQRRHIEAFLGAIGQTK
jgi:hypothetical protein